MLLCQRVQRRLDQALGLAVDLWPVTTGELLADAKVNARRAELPRSERPTVVDQHPLKGHAQRCEVRYRRSHERLNAELGLLGMPTRRLWQCAGAGQEEDPPRLLLGLLPKRVQIPEDRRL